MNFKKKKIEHWNKLECLRKKFKHIVDNVSADNYKDSINQLNKIRDEISLIISDLNRDYHDSVVKRLNYSEKMTVDNYDDFVKELIQTDKQIKGINKELSWLYPTPFFTFSILKQSLKKIYAVVFGLLFLLMVFIFIRFYTPEPGLLASYYSDQKFSNLYKKSITPKVKFNWKRGSPLPGWKKDNFAIRWTGYLHTEDTRIYRFMTISDDGVRLWIGDNLLIDDWKIGKLRENTAEIKLKAGYYPITLEYFEEGHTASVNLAWRWAGRWHTIAPKYLLPKKRYLLSKIPLHK